MTYTVVWKPEAERRLAHLWLTARDRPAVTASADAIDQSLVKDPETKGLLLYRDRRFLLNPPLSVIFEVHPLDRKVQVLTIWRNVESN